jgi:predicted RNase H-like HicB family nuclease
MNISHYTYGVTWSAADQEHVGLCVEFPSLSWLAPSIAEAMQGVQNLVAEVVADMQANGELLPTRSPAPLQIREVDAEAPDAEVEPG